MTKPVTITLCLCAAIWGSLATPSLGAVSCQEANDVVDKDVSSSNVQMTTFNEGIADIADFLQDFEMSFLWFTLPSKTNVYATNGMITLGNLSRSGDAVQCSDSSSVSTLQGVLNFDEVRVKYDMTAKFYRWQTDGSFSCSFRQPSVNLLYTKGDALGCRIASFSLKSLGNLECEVTPDNNSWGSWFAGKALHYALLSKQPSPDSIVTSFLQASYSMIETTFGNYWCQ